MPNATAGAMQAKKRNTVEDRVCKNAKNKQREMSINISRHDNVNQHSEHLSPPLVTHTLKFKPSEKSLR